MRRPISVVDATSGAVNERDAETLTRDLPPGFAPGAIDLVVDADRLGHYQTASGEARVYLTAPRQLRRRWRGEECLVAAQEVERGGAVCTRRYLRSIVEPRGSKR